MQRDLQYAAIPISFTITALGCALPWFLRKWDRAYRLFGVLLALSTGVIIGGLLFHIIPEASIAWDEYKEAQHAEEEASGEHEEEEEGGHSHPYPFWALIGGCVFFLLVAIDSMFSGPSHDGNRRGHNHLLPPQPIELTQPSSSSDPAQSEVQEIIIAHDGGQTRFHNPDSPVHKVIPVSSAKEFESSEHSAPTHSNGPQMIAFALAMSIHSLFDGLSIGTNTDSKSAFYSVLIAVLAHKLLDGFALGLPVFHAKMPGLFKFLCLFITIISCPIGIAIGIGVSSSLSASKKALGEAILLSFSAGSFLYIGVYEMLTATMMAPVHKLVQIGAILVGFAFMATLAIWT